MQRILFIHISSQERSLTCIFYVAKIKKKKLKGIGLDWIGLETDRPKKFN